jgi:hypothetical protein
MQVAGRAGERCGREARGRPNGSDVKLRGQGPRAEAVAARHAPACEARDARGVPPSSLRCTRRLGRRAEAGPRQLLRRVRPQVRSLTFAKHLEQPIRWQANLKTAIRFSCVSGVGVVAPRMRCMRSVECVDLKSLDTKRRQ